MIRTINDGKPIAKRLTRISKLNQRAWLQLNKINILPSDIKYDLTISHEKKLVWFRVPKVGTRTIIKILKSASVSLDAEHPYNCYYPPRLYRDYFKFAFVRNPWDRLLSCWLDKVVKLNLYNFSEAERKSMQEFDNFIDYICKLDLNSCDGHLRLQSGLIDLNNIKFIGRYETFENDIYAICAILKIDLNEIPKLNFTIREKNSYRDYYSQNSKEKILNAYAKDIQIFGYQF